jgi:hypothetical protein
MLGGDHGRDRHGVKPADLLAELATDLVSLLSRE